MWNTERIEYFSGIIRIKYYIGVAVFIDLFNDPYGEIDSLLKIRGTLGLNHSDIYESFFFAFENENSIAVSTKWNIRDWCVRIRINII